MPFTGDLTRAASLQCQATALPYTKVDKADLGDAGHCINQAHLSGKQDGAGVIAVDSTGLYSLCIATGSAPTDAWVKAGGTAAETVTPA